ncbi:MAG: hypothetical protein MRY49_00980 [Candidatus Pacebacteria bacterium]|nr:hypothetical protein [Candidatus Paceibacterota bacterium]
MDKQILDLMVDEIVAQFDKVRFREFLVCVKEENSRVFEYLEQVAYQLSQVAFVKLRKIIEVPEDLPQQILDHIKERYAKELAAV